MCTRNLLETAFIIYIVLAVPCQADTDNTEVIFSTILFRHGDRTVIEPYPNDPYKDIKYWPEGFGQLTNKGKLQHYSLGTWLRNRYSHLVSKEYNVNTIYIRATDVDRTIMSALSNLAGLYPPTPDQMWSPQIKDWQPIPVHTIPEHLDNVVAGKKECPRYNYEMDLLMKSKKFQQIQKQNEELYKNLTLFTGKPISSINDVEFLYDILQIEDSRNYALPNWTKPYYPNVLREWSRLSFTLQCYNLKLQRLKIGLLLNEIIHRMQMKVSNQLTPNRHLWFYSAHDTTVANVLMALGLFDHECPPYTATIMFDLIKKNDRYGVSIFYKNRTDMNEPNLLKLEDCEEFCELEKFREILGPILLTSEQWDEDCQIDFLTKFAYKSEINVTTIAVVILGAVLIIILIVIVAVAITYFGRRQNRNNKVYYRLDGFEK